MRFAYIIKGDFDIIKDKVSIRNGFAQIIGVNNVKEACKISKELVLEGISCIELCGGFNINEVKEIIKATDNKIPIGYVTHLKEQDEVYKQTFNLK